jgi:hypothetical protein
MCLRFGFAADGGPDTAAAAEAMEVSRRTVQRWLHADHGRSIAHIPTRRREQLIALLRPAPETMAREDQQARYALKAIDGLRLPRKRGIKPAWERQRWLEPHRVVVLEIHVKHLRIRQLAICRDVEERAREVERRGKVVDQASVPTRFHATVLAHEVLAEMAPWRFEAGPDQVVQGYTQAWMVEPSTPKTHLATAALLLARPPTPVEATRSGRRGRRRVTDQPAGGPSLDATVTERTR